MLSPMLATLAEAPLVDPELVYEPKYDGIRAVADVDPGGASVRLWSRLGNDKTAQFPEVAGALRQWARRRRERVVLDGEIVALNASGEPAGFQQLQGRIHVKDEHVTGSATAFILFDVLTVGANDLRDRPLRERRGVLERLFQRAAPDGVLRLSEQVTGDGRALYDRALALGWEGLIAKHALSKYRSGKRSADWRKLKIIQEQEFVVGGWTEPRQTRAWFGALLLGVYDGGRLVYAGHTGTGFDEKALARVMARLTPLETQTCPFAVKPKSNERPHWVKPELVAQIKFTEWTADQHLRHPVYLGLRDDKDPRTVVRESTKRHHASVTQRITRRPSPAPAPARRKAAVSSSAKGTAKAAKLPASPELDALLERLRALEDARRDGTIELPGGESLEVTNLHKVFWPSLSITKGDLFRYYAAVSPAILPVLADRPLVMKRFPNGVDAKPFYQHRAEKVPAGVRVEPVAAADARPQIIGGSLKTLLYTAQLAAISQDPWFSRVQSPDTPDHVALDLDPSDDVPFTQVLDVARWIHDELESLGVFALAKTSGASGLHVFVPLAPGTPYEAGLLFAQLVATLVAEKHPKVATVERAVKARGRRVYVDYLQNIQGKTLASAYSVRASAYAGVSTPLTWKEVHAGVEREAFTIRTMPERLRTLGDLWAPLFTAPGADLNAIAHGD
ncbi:MAG: DNA ligase D [Vicinamibacterales bacterium]